MPLSSGRIVLLILALLPRNASLPSSRYLARRLLNISTRLLPDPSSLATTAHLTITFLKSFQVFLPVHLFPLWFDVF